MNGYYMRSGIAFWLAIGAITLVEVGMHLWQDRAEERENVMGRKKVRAYFCGYCENLYSHDIELCPDCDAELETLEFASIAQLDAHIKLIETMQIERGLSTRMPGYRYTSVQAELFAAFEAMNNCILYARPAVMLPTQDKVQTSAPPSIDMYLRELYRLEFARHLVATGKLVPGKD